MNPLVAISIALLVMLFTIYKKVNLNFTILMGIILTSFLFDRSALIFSDTIDTMLDYGTISLMLMVYFVFFLTNFLSSTGIMKRVISSLENIITDSRIVMATIPALIGLMPSPSGAVISAPFVDEIGEKSGIKKEKRLLINYWFRHISEYINPVYPGVLLATGILGISYHSFFISNFPIMAFYSIAGIFFYILPIKKPKVEVKRIHAKDLLIVVKGVAPVIAAVTLPIVFKIDLSISLLVSILCALLLNMSVKKDIVKISRDSFKYDLIILVFLVMLFKNVLEKSNATTLISSSFIGLGAPTALLLIIIPMIIGFLTGLAMGYVGLSFPLLMPFFEISGKINMSLVTLAFVSGYIGVLLSPMHLCFSVTQKYFNADLIKTYKLLLPPVALTFVWTLVIVVFG